MQMPSRPCSQLCLPRLWRCTAMLPRLQCSGARWRLANHIMRYNIISRTVNLNQELASIHDQSTRQKRCSSKPFTAMPLEGSIHQQTFLTYYTSRKLVLSSYIKLNEGMTTAISVKTYQNVQKLTGSSFKKLTL